MKRKTTVGVINDKIIKDPVIIDVMKMIFDWSNQMGLEGVKCSNLQLEDEDYMFCHCVNITCDKEDPND